MRSGLSDHNALSPAPKAGAAQERIENKTFLKSPDASPCLQSLKGGP